MSNPELCDNVWNILDKIISATVHFQHTITDPNKKNSRTITVKLSDYADSCGYTQEIHQKFFDVSNRVDSKRRKCLENLGIIFEDVSGGCNRKKLTFSHILPPPLLYYKFVLHEEMAVVAGGPIVEQFADNPAVAAPVAAAPPAPALVPAAHVVDLNNKDHTV